MAVTSDSLDFTFLDAVNRVLRTNGIIKGDDDNVTTFSDTQHNATLNLAQIAIQDELVEMTVDKAFPLERAEGTLTTSVGARIYDLASDFVQFYGDALLYDSANNRHLYQYPGGEKRLRMTIYDYKTQAGDPSWWYLEQSTKKKIAFFQVPNVARSYTYDYERSVYVINATDEIPLHNNEEAHAFCAAASRRFKFLFENAQNLEGVLKQDASYIGAKARLLRLIKGMNPSKSYGSSYI
jgi:hypothetical protein